MTLDEKELKTQLLSLSSKVFTYDYKNGGKSGYLAKKIGSEKLERFDTILEELYGGNEQKTIGTDILKEARKEFNKLKIKKTEKKEFEIDGQKRNCAGYQFTISKDNVKNVLDAAEKAVKKKYGDGTKISADPVGKVFMVFYDKISAAGEMECSVYLYQNKLASVSVNYEDDENAQNIDVLFLGGDFRTQNMKIAFYNVDLEYIDYLKQYETSVRGFTRVPNVNYRSGNNKFFYGTVLNINRIDYFVPISSKQHNRQDDIQIKPKNDKYCNEYATLRFAYMLPIPHKCINMLNINGITNNTRRERIRKELAFCNKYRDKIKKQAQNTYYRITNKVNDRLVHNSCDFKLLEQAYIDFCNEHNIPIDKNKVN